MRKVNVNELEESGWSSPAGSFRAYGKDVSIALGRLPDSTDVLERHPFDLEITRIPAGATPFPYHSHGAQWEMYLVLSGSGTARSESGETPIGPGDAFLFKPGEAHGFSAGPDADLVMYVIADNPIADSTHYPDSRKWVVKSPDRRVLRGIEAASYWEGEEG